MSENTKFEANKLVLGEVAKVEDLSGQSISVLGKEEAPKGLLLAAIAFVWKKRSQPDFTWNDALGLTLDEANDILGLTADEEEEADAAVTFDGSVIGGQADGVEAEVTDGPFQTQEPSDS